MTFSRWFPVVVAFAAALSGAAKPANPGRAYVGAVVTDAATGQVLFEDNAEVVTPPASMTKLMTFAVLHDKLAAFGGTPFRVATTMLAMSSGEGSRLCGGRHGRTLVM